VYYEKDMEAAAWLTSRLQQLLGLEDVEDITSYLMAIGERETLFVE
jgi:hypothetical protein